MLYFRTVIVFVYTKLHGLLSLLPELKELFDYYNTSDRKLFFFLLLKWVSIIIHLTTSYLEAGVILLKFKKIVLNVVAYKIKFKTYV